MEQLQNTSLAGLTMTAPAVVKAQTQNSQGQAAIGEAAPAEWIHVSRQGGRKKAVMNATTRQSHQCNINEDSCPLLALPQNVLAEGVLSFLQPKELATLGSCNKTTQAIAADGSLWQSLFQKRFPHSDLSPVARTEWKLAYRLSLTKSVDPLRCFVSKRTFFEDVLGVGVSFTVNPKTKEVDYIALSQDLLSSTAFERHKIRSDAFGNAFKLFLPLYFTEEHFRRALPLIRKTIVALHAPGGRVVGRPPTPIDAMIRSRTWC